MAVIEDPERVKKSKYIFTEQVKEEASSRGDVVAMRRVSGGL